MYLYFEECNIVSKEKSKCILIANGFNKEIITQDFPVSVFTSNLYGPY